jgi:hypothetical protein
MYRTIRRADGSVRPVSGFGPGTRGGSGDTRLNT